MPSYLILGARIVNENRIYTADILIKNGRIEQIGTDLSSKTVDRVIEASGKYVLPGMIDDQVHFRDPGLTYKGDFYSESKAAVAGGITSVLDMPNNIPPVVTQIDLENKFNLVTGRSFVNFGFYFGANEHNLEQIKKLDNCKVCGLKVFMGASTGNLLVENETALEAIFKNSPVMVTTHCEHNPTIEANKNAMTQKYGEEIPLSCHPLIRSREACFRSSEIAISLARKWGTRLHILHITTADELSLFESGPLLGKQITSEVCVHHLSFNDQDYEKFGNLIKCNPAIKTAKDQQALLAAVNDDVIDVIGTDHAPHSLAEKNKSYIEAPAGISLMQYAYLALLEKVQEGIFTLPLVVHKVSHAVADLFRIEQRGYIREGYWADIVLVDMDLPDDKLEDRHVNLSKCGWSPFDSFTFHSRINATFVNGILVFESSTGVVGEPLGQALKYSPK